MQQRNAALDPSSILQTAFGFWQSKVLLTAVEFGLFTRLAGRRLTGAELGAELRLHPRAAADFFDALVAMRFLGRDGEGPLRLHGGGLPPLVRRGRLHAFRGHPPRRALERGGGLQVARCSRRSGRIFTCHRPVSAPELR